MNFERMTPETYHKAKSIKAFSKLMEKALKYKELATEDPTRVVYLINSNETPVGLCALGKIIPGEKAEFGIACEPQIAIRAGVKFLKSAFQTYGFKFIYSIPVDEQAKNALVFGGFINIDGMYIIDLPTLERKWR